MPSTAPPSKLEQQLRDMNEALLISSVRQHELTEQAQKAGAACAAINEELATELAATQRLQQMSARLIQAGDSAGLYEDLVDAAVVIMRSDMASMQILDHQRAALRMLAHHGFEPAFGQAFEWVSANTNTSCGMALRSGSRVVVPDIETFPGIAGTPSGEAQRAVGIRATTSTPLVSRAGHMLGMITAHWRTPHEPPERDLRRLDILARQAADLIERAHSETALRASELRYRRLFESAKVCLLILDADTGVITDANPFSCEFFGCSAGELTGKELWQIGVFKDMEASRAAFRELQENGYVRYDDLTLAARTGQGRVVELVSNTYSVGGTKVIQCNIRDVTERKRAETARRQAHDELERRVEERTAELKEAQRKALQAERLAAMGQMMAGLAHESRNALQRIQASLSMLSFRLEGRPEDLDLVARMQLAQDDLHRLHNEVHDYAAPIQLDRCVCRLAVVWREAWQELDYLATKKAELREETDDDGECLADPFRLKQVFRNLLENALDAGGDAPRVAVRCTRADVGGQEAVRVAVRDNGPGFAPEQRSKLFEPFFTTKLHGTGLGLAICKRVVEAHGGRIEAGSGPGAEVVITIPRGEL